MKHFTFVAVASLMIVGCAVDQDKQAMVAPQQPVAVATASPMPGRTSAALAFDPPITQDGASPDLARDQRGQAALVGFEEAQTSSYDVFTYNRQASDNSNYYDKEAVSERVGTTHR